jgi:glycosyltransferase involved in cell wall biosynthesis
MKNVLLLHPTLLFYRVPIYNKLAKYLRQHNYNLVIWYTDKQPETEPLEFETPGNLEMNARNYRKILEEHKIDIVINFLYKSQPGYAFYLFAILYTKLSSRKIYFYGHGVNLNTRDSRLHNVIYNILHLLFDRIILYSPAEKKYLWPIHQKKIHVAYNTLDLSGCKERLNGTTVAEVKRKYGIRQNFLVLFSGRIQERKKLGLLVDIFTNELKDSARTGLLIVGPDMTEDMKRVIAKHSNLYYIGPVYDREEMGKIFYASDVFCIPGHIGLGVVEAMYWGLPTITTNVIHAPEIYYLKNEYNGYIVENRKQLHEKIVRLSMNRHVLEQLSSNAAQTYRTRATLDKMFAGFLFSTI